MTREEAIKYFKRHLDLYCVDGISREAEEAAIQALSQEPTIGQLFSCEEVQELRSKIWKQVEQEPCETCGYVEGSPFCLQYCPYDAERKKEQEPCDAISREAVNTLVDELARAISDERCHIPQRGRDTGHIMHDILELPSVTQKSGKCKNCKYFEYDSVAKVDGIPLIVAHEICNKWGNGCKTSEDGYCYLFEPQERSKE